MQAQGTRTKGRPEKSSKQIIRSSMLSFGDGPQGVDGCQKYNSQSRLKIVEGFSDEDDDDKCMK